jgi:hypothetical protein
MTLSLEEFIDSYSSIACIFSYEIHKSADEKSHSMYIVAILVGSGEEIRRQIRS